MHPAGRAWSKCRGFSPAQRLSSGAAAHFIPQKKPPQRAAFLISSSFGRRPTQDLKGRTCPPSRSPHRGCRPV
jgi:hypothetical protein